MLIFKSDLESKGCAVIDAEGYRANVAVIILNQAGQVFLGKRLGQDSWQFPQGGVNPGESVMAAMYRELFEEVGLRPQDVAVLAATPDWIQYELPTHMVRKQAPVCVGQKQKWFLLRLLAQESHINLHAGEKAEFDAWRWVPYWSPLTQVVYFKHQSYQHALDYFAKLYPPAPDSHACAELLAAPMDPALPHQSHAKKSSRFWLHARRRGKK